MGATIKHDMISIVKMKENAKTVDEADATIFNAILEEEGIICILWSRKDGAGLLDLRWSR